MRSENAVRYLILVCSLLILTACNEIRTPPGELSVYDQCLRSELFQQCLKALPAGPVATKYNDWNEVISECSLVAKKLSLRKTKNVKEECRYE